MTIVLFLTWQFNKSFPGTKEWFLGFFCALTNYIIFIFKPMSIPLLQDLTLQLLLICTGMFAYLGCKKYAREKLPSRRMIAIIIGATLMASVIFNLAGQAPQIGYITSSFMAGLLCSLGAWSLLRKSTTLEIRHILGVTLLIHGLFMMIRPLLFHRSIELILISWIGVNAHVPIIFQQIIFTPLLTIGILLIINSDNLKQLRFQAEYDQLTDSRNRNSFLKELQKAASLSLRLKTPLTVLVIDLDHFKSINDEYGHFAGDEILKSFSKIAKKCIRDADGFGRIGGEEFAIFLMNTPIETALTVAERIRSLTQETSVQFQKETIHFTASIGIAEFDPNSSIDKALQHADKALYLAKRNGRNRIEVWSDS